MKKNENRKTVWPTTPPRLPGEPDGGLPKEWKIYVPSAAVEAYRKLPGGVLSCRNIHPIPD